MQGPEPSAEGQKWHRRVRQAALAVWALLSVLSIVKLRTFHAGLYDLGIFHQVLWNTAHGRPFASSLKHMSYLGDHFSPTFGLLAPLEWLPFSLDLLLIAQAGAAVATAWIIYRSARRHLESARIAGLIGLMALCYPPLFCPPVFDIHPEPFMAVALAWGLDELDRGRPGWAALWMAITLGGKEEAGLLLAPLGVALALAPPTRRFGVALALVSLLWSGLVMAVLMPHFRPPAAPGSRWFYLDRYSHLGMSPVSIARFTVLHPLSALARSSTPWKLVTALVLLLGFAGAPLCGGRWLLAALPLALAHYVSLRTAQFNYWFQYLTLLVPVLGRAAVAGAPRTIARRPRLAAAVALTVGLGFGLGTRLWLPWYVPEQQYATLERAIALVPKEASVCTQQVGVGPWLAARREIDFCVPWELERAQYRYYGWPEKSDAEYQIFDLNDIALAPMMPARVEELRHSATVLLDERGVVVFRLPPPQR
jgi:uncharacterized membrane protein